MGLSAIVPRHGHLRLQVVIEAATVESSALAGEYWCLVGSRV